MCSWEGEQVRSAQLLPSLESFPSVAFEVLTVLLFIFPFTCPRCSGLGRGSFTLGTWSATRIWIPTGHKGTKGGGEALATRLALHVCTRRSIMPLSRRNVKCSFLDSLRWRAGGTWWSWQLKIGIISSCNHRQGLVRSILEGENYLFGKLMFFRLLCSATWETLSFTCVRILPRDTDGMFQGMVWTLVFKG